MTGFCHQWKKGVPGDEVAGLVEDAASLRDRVVEVVDRVEELVDDRLVDERPETLGGLYFRDVGRQVDKLDPVGDDEVRQGVPAGIVEYENDDAVASSAGCAREVGEELFEEGLVDSVRHVPNGLAAHRMDEGDDIEPLVAVMAKRDRPHADGSPDAAADRLQAESVLVRRLEALWKQEGA